MKEREMYFSKGGGHKEDCIVKKVKQVLYEE